MKVCVINPNYYRSSGVTIAIRRIFEEVSKLGVEQHFINCCYGNEEEDKDWIPQERYCEFKLMSSNPAKLIYEILLFIKWLKKNDIHVIHVHHRRLASILLPLQLARVSTVLYTGQLTYQFTLCFWLASPKFVAAISQSVMKNVQATTRAKYIEVIGNPSEFPIQCPKIEIDRVKNRAICIARLEPVKGHEYLIDAWRILKNRGFEYELILVGEGSLRQQLEQKAVALDLSNNIHFRGYKKNVMKEMESCLFAILVSEIEGQGIVTLEAAACGRASLLTNVDGSRDCLPPQRYLPNGLPYGDSTALADALELWFANPIKVATEGRVFFDFHKALNSKQIIGNKYYLFYKKLCMK